MRIAILGAGLMGSAIAAAFAAGGCRVRVYDPFDAVLRQAKSAFNADVGHAVAWTTNLQEALLHVDAVFEAVPEDLEMKAEVLAQVSDAVPETLIASNTSGFRITELARFVTDPRRFVGAHFFNPADVVPLVEVTPGEQTATPTIREATELLASIGKKPIELRRDVPGFIANRLQHAMWREAFALVEDGVCDAETIDAVVLNSFGPRLGAVGPMEHADFIGLDLVASVQDYLLPHLAVGSTRSELLRKSLDSGRFGRKTGEGLMPWTESKGSEVSERLLTHLRNTWPEQ